MVADVNVTRIPAQTGLFDAVIEILTGRFGFTVIVIVFEMAGFPVGQIALEVRMQDNKVTGSRIIRVYR